MRLAELELEEALGSPAERRTNTVSNHLPVRLQSIHAEQDEDKDEVVIRAGMTTAGRNNEAIERVVMRLSMEDDVSTISWSIIESAME